MRPTAFSQDERSALFICCMCQGTSEPLFHPLPAQASKPSTVFSLYISPRLPQPSQFSYRSDNEKTPKSAARSGANPRPASVVHRVSVWPTTAEVGDPWTPSIRLSAPALASAHTEPSAREWKHATGNCSNVSETAEPYKNDMSAFSQRLTCSASVSACRLTHAGAFVCV